MKKRIPIHPFLFLLLSLLGILLILCLPQTADTPSDTVGYDRQADKKEEIKTDREKKADIDKQADEEKKADIRHDGTDEKDGNAVEQKQTSVSGNQSDRDQKTENIVGVQSEETQESVSEAYREDHFALRHTPAADRVVYQDGFYYESVTEELKERINGLSYKKDCTVPYEELRYLAVHYYDFDDKEQIGEIVCNKAIAQDLIEIFHELYTEKYQIDKIRLVDEYDADDDRSCADNNTSCFNYRTVPGKTKLSNHARGLAIDINPFQNPYITYPDGKEHISPEGSEAYADRSKKLSHMIDEKDLCYQLFAAHGFTWGGHWKSVKDYQHFEKSLQ